MTRIRDPDRAIEVSADVEARRHRKIEEKEAIPVKLSHVVLNSPDLDQTKAWYEEHLRFRPSDTLGHPHIGDVMHFMRISNQHYSMAIAKGPHTPTSSTRRATPSSTRPSWSCWTRTPGVRTSTTSPSPRSPTRGAPPIPPGSNTSV